MNDGGGGMSINHDPDNGIIGRRVGEPFMLSDGRMYQWVQLCPFSTIKELHPLSEATREADALLADMGIKQQDGKG